MWVEAFKTINSEAFDTLDTLIKEELKAVSTPKTLSDNGKVFFDRKAVCPQPARRAEARRAEACSTVQLMPYSHFTCPILAPSLLIIIVISILPPPPPSIPLPFLRSSVPCSLSPLFPSSLHPSALPLFLRPLLPSPYLSLSLFPPPLSSFVLPSSSLLIFLLLIPSRLLVLPTHRGSHRCSAVPTCAAGPQSACCVGPTGGPDRRQNLFHWALH